VNSVQELEVDGGQVLDCGQELELNGRQEVEVEVDGGPEMKFRIMLREKMSLFDMFKLESMTILYNACGKMRQMQM
jgi:hypothetical protein